MMENNEEGNDSCIFLLNEGDIGMANHEKRVEQEAAYPILISVTGQ